VKKKRPQIKVLRGPCRLQVNLAPMGEDCKLKPHPPQIREALEAIPEVVAVTIHYVVLEFKSFGDCSMRLGNVEARVMQALNPVRPRFMM